MIWQRRFIPDKGLKMCIPPHLLVIINRECVREGSLTTRLIRYLQTLTCKQHEEVTVLGFESDCGTKKMKRRGVSNKRQGN